MAIPDCIPDCECGKKKRLFTNWVCPSFKEGCFASQEAPQGNLSLSNDLLASMQLLALCQGLELENIRDLLTKPPKYFETVGRMLALKMTKCKCE